MIPILIAAVFAAVGLSADRAFKSFRFAVCQDLDRRCPNSGFKPRR